MFIRVKFYIAVYSVLGACSKPHLYIDSGQNLRTIDHHIGIQTELNLLQIKRVFPLLLMLSKL